MKTAPAEATSYQPRAVFRQSIVSADGCALRYLEAGQGEPVVMLHGVGGLRFSPALDLLADRYRVIVVEMPGFGEHANQRHKTLDEMAETIAQVPRSLGLDRYHLLGTSIGGAVAVHLALARPDLVKSLVLEAPATFRVGAKNPDPAMGNDELRGLFRQHPDRPPTWQPPDPIKHASVWQLVQRMLGSTPEYDEQLAARLSDCQVRALVIFGDRDTFIPADNGRTFRRLMPNCSFILIHDAAHDVQADRPDAFVDVVTDFLARGWLFLLPDQSTLINP